MRRGRLAPWIHSHVTEFDQHLQKILRQQVGQFVAGLISAIAGWSACLHTDNRNRNPNHLIKLLYTVHTK